MDIQNISQELSYQEINSLQENLSFIVKSRIRQFFDSIEKNNLQEINSFVQWGIPQDNTQFKNNINHLVFKPNIQLNTINTLYNAFQNQPELQNHILMKVVVLLSTSFDTATKKNIFNTSDFYFTDLLLWLKEKNLDTFSIHFRKLMISNWGTIPFDIKSHQQLEEYYLNNSSNHTNAILKASRKSTYAIMKHICSPLYLSHFQALSKAEQSAFWRSCLEKAIQNSNIETIQFLFDMGIELPDSTNCYSHFIQNSHNQKGFQEVLDFLIEKAGTPLFNNHVLLRSALSNNHIINTKLLLDKYYKNPLYIESLSGLTNNQKISESFAYLKQFYVYWSLSSKLEEKDIYSPKMKL